LGQPYLGFRIAIYDFSHNGSLSFSWSNRRDNQDIRLSRLDRYYVGNWACDRGGRVTILDGYGTLSDYLPVQLVIHRKLRNEEGDMQFRFNTFFLEDPQLINQMQTI
jgi:hypothetical protein